MMRFALVLSLVASLAAFAVRGADDAEWKAQVQAELKALREQNAALQKRVDASEAKAKDIKMDAVVQKAIDNAVARVGTGAKYGNSYLNFDRPDIKGTGLVFNGEFLYLKPQQSNQEFALLSDPGAFGPLFSSPGFGKIKQVELDWSPGFRIGLGYRLPHDGWDLSATYTYYRSDSSKSLGSSAVPGQLKPLIFNTDRADDFADIGRASLDLRLDSFDLLLGRTYKTSETTTVGLHGGLAAAWISDDMRARFFGTDYPSTAGLGAHWDDKNDFSGFGLKLGVDGDWRLFHGISLFGKADVSLLTGKFELHHFEAQDVDNNGVFSPLDTEIDANTRQEVHRIVPVTYLSAGAAWNHKINSNLNIKVSAGYEMTNYFNFIHRRQFTDDSNEAHSILSEGNFGLHGFVFKIKLDF